jgi:nucleoid-associated protein YgaU
MALSRMAQHIPWPGVLEQQQSLTQAPLASVPPPHTAVQSLGSTEGGAAAQSDRPLAQQPDKFDAARQLGTPNEAAGKEPPPGSVPKDAVTIPAVKLTEPPVVRTMNKGDSVSKIAAEVYGVANDATLEFIKKHNPHIQDINKVAAGTKIILPKLPTPTE